MDHFRTNRLWAERLAPSHLDELVVLHKDAAVMSTLGGIRDAHATEEFLAANLRHWDKHDFGLWIFRNAAGQFVGRGGIRHLEIEDRDEIEIAYAVAADFWNQGLATEMAQGLLEVAFDQLR